MGRIVRYLIPAALVAAFGFWIGNRAGSEGPRSINSLPSKKDVSEKVLSVSPPVSSEVTISAEDERKLRVLSDIFAAKNDNDPRMDTELRHLSPAIKNTLRRQYEALAPEARNERGTIVFLLGRELNSGEDVAFLDGVLREAPCLGLESCGAVDRGDDHSQLGSDTTLAYPQLVAVRAYRNYLRGKDSNPDLAKLIQDSLAAAKGSRNPLIAKAAAEAQN